MTKLDPSKDASTNREIYEEARDRLAAAESADAKNRVAAKTDILFREGDQWDTDSTVTTTASAEKPQLVINFTNALCQRIENNIRENCPRGGVHPIGDGADVDIAEVIEGIGRHVELRSSAADVAYAQAARSAVTCGVGYFRLIAEWEHTRSFQKELRIVPIRNVFSVYMDPSSTMPAGEDACWCIITTKMRRPEFKRRYPKATNADFRDGSQDRLDKQWENKAHIRLAEYFRIIEKSEKLHLLKHPTGATRALFESELPNKTGDFEIISTRDALRRQVEWYRLNGTQVVEKAVMPGNWIPVFRVEGNRIDVDGEVITRGEVRFQRDPQRMVNFGETAKIMRLGLAPKAPWVMAEGQDTGHDEWNDANQQSYSVLKYKPITISTAQGEIMVPPPMRQEPAPIEQGFSEMVAGQRSNLLFVSGMPADPGQDMQGQVVSGRALERRDKMQDKSHLQYTVHTGLAVAQCWRVMLDWSPAIYKEPGRIQRVIGEDSVPDTTTLNQPVKEQGAQGQAIERVKNDLSVGRYDVAMDAGPGYETRREEGAEALLDLLKSPPIAQAIAQHGLDLVFRSLDHPYMQELADRLIALTPDGLQQVLKELPSRAQSIVRALYGQVQALQQQVQQLTLDLKGSITKAHIAATVKAHDVEETNKTRRADTLIRAETARDVAAIQVGGKLLDTHVDASHKAAQALMEGAEKAESRS